MKVSEIRESPHAALSKQCRQGDSFIPTEPKWKVIERELNLTKREVTSVARMFLLLLLRRKVMKLAIDLRSKKKRFVRTTMDR